MSGPLAGASYEYDATVAASITGALNVTAWADQSGNGRDLNSVVGTPKTGIRTINGLNAISFAGGSELLFRSPLVIASPRTFFAVVQSNVSAGPSLNAELKWVNHGGGGSGLINTNWCGEGGGTNLTGGRVDNAPHVITWVNNGTSSAIWVDGLLVVSGGDATTSSTADIEIGGDGGSQGWNGLIGHVFGYPSALNASDRNLVEQYLTAKWLAIPNIPTFAPPWGTGHPAAIIPAIDLTDYDPNSGVAAPDHVGVGVDLSGSGAASATGNADLSITADLSGQGIAAAGSRVTFSVTADLRGHGDAASAGTATPLLTAGLSGSGAASSYGVASPIATVLLTGKGTAASTGNANLSITADLSGKGSNAAGSRAEVLLTADLRGHGDAAAGSTAPLTATLSLSGHGDASSVGRADISVSSAGGSAISLSGTGAAASTGTASPIITAALSGKGAAASTGRADVYLTAGLSGKGTAASTGTASINNTAALSGAGTASSTGRANIDVVAGTAISGSGAAASAGTASLSVTVSLSGHGDGCSAGSGTLGKTVFLTGSGAAASGGRASFPVAVVVSAEQDSYSGARRNRILTINVRWVYPCRVTTSCTFVARRNTRCGHQIRTKVDTTTSRRHVLTASSQYQARTVTLADRLQDDMDAILAVLGARQETSL